MPPCLRGESSLRAVMPSKKGKEQQTIQQLRKQSITTQVKKTFDKTPAHKRKDHEKTTLWSEARSVYEAIKDEPHLDVATR